MEFTGLHSIAGIEVWLGFILFVFFMIALDVLVLGGNKAHRVSHKEALTWTIIWITLALIFNVCLWWFVKTNYNPELAHKLALEFFTGYLIEKSLSVDNLFVFLMIFQFFKVPLIYQRRALIYGVLGAVILRIAMILGGMWLVQQFHWILYVFGAFLLITGIKMLIFAEKSPDLADNPLVKWLSKHLNVTKTFHEEKFFVTLNGVLFVTPLFLAVVMIEISDVIFALDSIPAIFAITRDPFIVMTSNIFAILGLRALYFLLADMHEKFHLLKYGIAVILIIIGAKMLLAYWFHVPAVAMLLVVATLLAASIYLSIRYRPRIK